MTDIIQEEFDARQSDLDALIALTTLIDKGKILSIKAENGNEPDTLVVNEQLIDVLKSVIHIVTYNQVESTVRGCIEAVYDNLDDNNIGYDMLRKDIQKEILSGILKGYESGNTLHGKVGSELNLKTPRVSLNLKKVFSGNVSRDTFTYLKDSYGLKVNAPREARDGQDLGGLKNARNDLAHGNISFSKFGAKDSLIEFIAISGRTSCYLQSAIMSFEDYIENKQYLDAELTQ
jgi:hypothetical protein